MSSPPELEYPEAGGVINTLAVLTVSTETLEGYAAGVPVASI